MNVSHNNNITEICLNSVFKESLVNETLLYNQTQKLTPGWTDSEVRLSIFFLKGTKNSI